MNILSYLLKYVPNPLPTQAEQLLPSVEHPVRTSVSPDLKVRPVTGLSIHLGEHFGVVGATGSGKSTFGFALLDYLRQHYPKAKRYVIDSTADSNMEKIPSHKTVYGDVVPTLLTDPTYTLIWTPDTDKPALYNEFFEKILYAREETIVIVDELASLNGYRGSDPPDGYIKLLKQGRKHGITVVSLTQEIAKVTPTLFKQMTHYVQFRIGAEPYDLARSRALLDITQAEQHQPIARYGFFYRRVDGPYPAKEFASSQAFFRGSYKGN